MIVNNVMRIRVVMNKLIELKDINNKMVKNEGNINFSKS